MRSKIVSVVRIFTPDNRLTQVIGGPNDPTAASLVRDAETRLRPLQADIRKHVAAQCAIIAQLASGPEEVVFGHSREIGAAARHVCEIAGAAELNAVGEAARGVHAMIEALVSQGVWHTEALKLHVDAVALFGGDAAPNRAETDKILARLKAMRDWVGVPG